MRQEARWIMAKRLCGLCGQRPAKFRFRGVIKADEDHNLCMQCFRRQRDSTRDNPEKAEAPCETT